MNTLLSLIKSKLRSKKITQTYNGVLVFGAVIGAAIPACPAYSGESTGALPRLCNGDCTGIIQSVSGISGITSDATNMNIYQDQGTANLNWKTFDIGVGNTVQFHQPSAEAIAINKIFDNDPSKIYGNLIANGNVYLINTNGMLFGENSRVNVRSLITSTLDIQRDENGDPIAIGLAIEDGKAAFEHDGNTPMGMIRIEDGAILTTEGVDKDGNPFEAGGRIMIFAPQIENSGEINTPEGQTILAASEDKVYLQSFDGDKNIRGFYVEVNTGGDVKNLGKIIAEKGGNITLLGMAVNQSGLVQSTTTVTENGSIKIIARDSVNESYLNKDEKWLGGTLAGNTGTVVFGEGSVTQVVPEKSDNRKIVDDLEQLESWVEAVAGQISVEKNARISAIGGKIDFIATENPTEKTIGAKKQSRIYLSEGSVLDVSGSTGAVENMERNVVEVELRSNELKDSPIQREGALRGETVYVDIREGTDLADISGAVGGIERGVDERLADGGEINLSSDGDVLVEQGAAIDISGGQIEYQDGYISTTQLLKDGEIVDIGVADKNVSYDGLAGTYTKVDEKWGVTETWKVKGADTKARFEAGYIEGKDAGNLNINSNALVMEGTVNAKVTPGMYQRDSSATDHTAIPKGGSVAIDLRYTNGAVQNVIFSEMIDPILKSYVTTQPAEEFYPVLQFSTQMLKASGVSELKIETFGDIEIDRGEQVSLASGGKLDLLGGRINLDGTIKMTGGDVALTAQYATGKTADTPEVALGSSALIDVRGNWVNDTPELNSQGVSAQPVYVDGGNVKIRTFTIKSDEETPKGNIDINDGAVINASGGAWLQNNGKLMAGKGGNIMLDGEFVDTGGELRAAGLEQGGSLAISSSQIRIADKAGTSDLDELFINTDFFSQGGIAEYSFTSTAGGLKVEADAVIDIQAKNLQLNNGYTLQQSSDNIDAISTLTTLPQWQRGSTSISLAVSTGNLTTAENGNNLLHALDIGQGTRIATENGGTIKLSSNQNMFMDGTLESHGGEITLTLSDDRVLSAYEDLGYIANQGIWLGENAQINASATSVITPNDYGLRSGKLFDAGSININAQQGYVIAQQGSILNVSGDSAVFDIKGIRADGTIGLVEQQLAADAGSITIKSVEGMILNGNMRADAAEVAGARGGSLTIINNAQEKEKDLIANSNPNKLIDHLANPGIIHLHKNDFAPVYATGTAINDEMNGVAHVNSSMVEDGGFDSLNLVTTNIYDTSTAIDYVEIGKVVIDDGVNLQLRDSLQINTTDILVTGDVELGGTYTAIGRYSSPELRVDLFETYTGSLYSGNGSLSVRSDHIDLLGEFQISGAEQVNLNSSGNIRLNGSTFVNGDFDGFKGELKTAGDLNLNARQVYATTLTDYNLTIADNPEAVVTIGRPEGISSEDSGAPIMSVGSNITITAPQIMQNGVLKAPGGEITLQSGYYDSAAGDNGELVLLKDSDGDISGRVRLAENSITSVALGNKYNLFGYVSKGLDWKYQNPYSEEPAHDYLIDELPNKKITIDATDVELQQGSVVDISSSGDLYAYEFVPGIGGSSDVLTNNGDSFAIMPTANNPYGFNDLGIYEGFDYTPGSQVYLSGMNGLTAGNYTILPARYALLPGAYLVTPTTDSSGILPGQTQHRIDSAPIIAGKFVTAGTGAADSLWSGFVVEPGSIARTRSEYFNYMATPFFTAKALAMGENIGRMPIDAGHLALSAVDSMIIENTLNADPATGGKGAWIDIDTPNIKVYSYQQQLPDNVTTQGLAAVVDGSIYISAQGLNNLGADSILLGGNRNTAVNGTQLDVGAATVEVMSGAELNGNEILLAAQDKVTVAQNAAVIASGDKAVRDETINIVGDGALLRVSAADQVDLVRSGEVTANKGELLIEEGAMVSASGSMLLQGTKDTILNGSIQVGTEQQAGSLYLGASQISLSNDSNIEAGGLILPTAVLEQFNLDELVLSSYGALNIYNGVDLKLNNLKLEAAAINGIENDGSIANINVEETLTLSNPHSSDVNFAGEVVNNNGTLNLNAKHIVFGSEAIDTNEEYISQNLALNGFSHINMTATNGAIGKGNTQINFANSGASANVTLTTPMLTVASGSSLSLNATNSSLNLNSANSDPTIPAAIGGKLSLSADSVDIGSRIDMSGGLVDIHAANHINIDGVIDVSGQEKLFYDKTEYIPAGMVSLSSERGDVNINPITADEGDITRIDISSGSDTGGKAGTLAISAATGKANLGGTIAAAGIENGGSFLLDVKEHNNFDTLFATLNKSGFDNQIAVRLRDGDMNIGNVSTTINGRDITLAADQGSINLDQVTIDASGDISAAGKGGEVAIWAGQDLNISANTRITTAATVADKDGGDILLASQTGNIAIDNAARLDLSGLRNGRGGDLHIRAERTEDDVKVAMFDAEDVVVGADAIRIEVFKQREVDSTLDASDIASIKTETATFMTNCKNSGLCDQWLEKGVTVMPGVDVIASGDLTLTSDWDLTDWRYADGNGEDTIPGQLTIRTPGSIYLNQDLSDGIEVVTTKVGRTTVEQHTALPGETWGYRINAGADLTAANQLQVVDTIDEAGDLIIGSDTKLRTGSGDIDLAVSGDLEFTDQTSVIYTFGQAQNRGALDELEAAGKPVNSYFSGQYLDNGGDIKVDVGGDIIGAVSDQLQTAWQHRVWAGNLGSESSDSSLVPTVWGIEIGEFEQGIAALGGGDIDISAGGDLTDLNVSIASTHRFDGDIEYEKKGRVEYFRYSGSGSTLFGQGDMSVTANGDISGGVFSNDYGYADINSLGSIGDGSNDLGLIAMMMDSNFSIIAQDDISLQGVINSSWMYHDKEQPYIKYTFFYSYSPDSSIDLNAINGDIEIINTSKSVDNSYNITGSNSKFSFDSNTVTKDVGGSWDVYPSLTDAVAFNGSILLLGDLKLFPTAKSTMNLLAHDDIYTAGGQNVIIPDVDQSMMPSVYTPVKAFKANTGEIGVTHYLQFPADQTAPGLVYSNTPMHMNDFVPNRIVALNGSFASLDQINPLQFFSAKPATIIAGEDIKTAQIYIQNLRETDISIVQAGRNFSFFQLDNHGKASENSNSGIKVSGPGRLDVIAGGDIDLASSKGIYSIGNQENNALSDSGADITVMAGVGDSLKRTDYSAFVDRYLDQDTYAGLQQQVIDLMRGYSGNSSMTYEEAIELLKILPAEISELLINSGLGSALPLGINSNNLLSYMGSLQNYRSWLGDYLAAQGVNSIDDYAAMVQTFEHLPVYKQRELVMKIFFNELKEGGKNGVTNGAVAYDRGYAAIYELYQDYALEGYDVSTQSNLRQFLSQGTSFDGELSMYRSKVQTKDGGDINILIPGGRVFGGEAAAGDDDDSKAGEIGVVAWSEGDVNAFTRNDFLVNQSRVFAMDGGDILMWSSETNLDAGRGAKTARGVSEAEYRYDDWGNVIVLPPTSLSGSGIRTFGDGNVYLFAPVGVVDAGDAGIGTAGNLFVGAVEVKGADNFDIGGVAVGVQVSTQGDVSGMTSAGDVTSSATSSALDQVESIAEDKSVADEQLSWLEVFVEGLGNEGEIEVEVEEKKKKKKPRKKQKGDKLASVDNIRRQQKTNITPL